MERDLYGKLSLNTLLNYPTALDIHKVAGEKLAERCGNLELGPLMHGF